MTASANDVASAEVMAALDEADRLFDELITQQRQKVLRLAREAVPDITPDDVLNPHDFPELKAHPTFEYEDGILAGYIAAQMALRARVIARRRWAGRAPVEPS
jgi:hypothetical protein